MNLVDTNDQFAFLGGQSCNVLTGLYDMLPGQTIFFIVIQSTGGVVDILAGSTWSMERITD